jgi:hypothetical protein
MLYHLEKYNGKKTRHTCPNCGKKHEFTRYVVTATVEYLADHVGKCNREDNCGYHYKPRDFFRDGGEKPKGALNIKTPLPERPDYLPFQYVKKSMHEYEKEELSNYLAGIFGWDAVLDAFDKYRVGTIKRYGGRAIVFWQIDIQGCVRFGKVMKYGKNGHRIKKYVNSVHSILSKKGYVRKDYNTSMCYFGTHLLDETGTVNIVESEKTALFCYLKFGGLWLATSQMRSINEGRSRVLSGRNVILWPDCGKGYKDWMKRRKFVAKFAKSVTLKKWWDKKIEGQDLMDYYLEPL